MKYFKKYSHIIYPSLSESLGLVLIEAIKYRNIILSSNLKIFEEVIKPDFLFDPYSKTDISNAIKNSINIKNIRSRLIIRSKINTLEKLINN